MSEEFRVDAKMHDLFTTVLSKRDLSRAGELFSVADYEIVNDLNEVVSISYTGEQARVFYVTVVRCDPWWQGSNWT